METVNNFSPNTSRNLQRKTFVLLHNVFLFYYFYSALGSIGKKSSSVRDCLLWALHYGKKTAVRVEACATIGRLAFKDTEVVNVLRDMIVVEKNERIKR